MAFAEERINYKVGNGQKISFWNDNWIGGAPLQHQFPVLHNLFILQQATVAEMGTGQGWNLHLRRNLNDWQVDRIATFYTIMDRFNNLSEERDTIVWKKGREGIFSVNSASRELNRSNHKEESWPWKMIWKTKIP